MIRNFLCDIVITLFVVTQMCSCHPTMVSEADYIPVRIEEYTAIECESLPFISLGVDTPLPQIDNIQFGDSLVIIKAGNALYSFSLEDGHLITNYAKRGRGPREYQTIWDYACFRDTVLIYDIDRKRVLNYSEFGEFRNVFELSKNAMDDPLQSFYPLGNGYFIGKRIFGRPDTPELSLYDSGFRCIVNVGKDKLRSGIKLWSQFYKGKDDDVLYTRYFSNVIQRYTPYMLEDKYTIDFVGHNLKDNKRLKDEYDYIEYLNAHKKKYASLVSNLVETDNVLSFQFVFNGTCYLSVWCFTEQKGRVFSFNSNRYDIQQIIYHDGDVLIFAADKESIESRVFKYHLK